MNWNFFPFLEWLINAVQMYPPGSHHTTAESPRRLIFHMIQTYRQCLTDFADSPAALSINNAKVPLTLLPPHLSPLRCHAWVYISVANQLSQASDTAFPQTLHQPPAQEPNQAGNRCKRKQRQPELRQLKALLASVFVWHAVMTI